MYTPSGESDVQGTHDQTTDVEYLLRASSTGGGVRVRTELPLIPRARVCL